VGGEAAADDQHSLVPKRGEPTPYVVQGDGIEGGHRDLQHRHVCLGVHFHQGYVGAVVETAGFVAVDLLAVTEQSGHVLGQVGAPGAGYSTS
jgi:hypothetical protein